MERKEVIEYAKIGAMFVLRICDGMEMFQIFTME
jgi:hypothetical protein